MPDGLGAGPGGEAGERQRGDQQADDVLRWERRFVRFIRSPLSAHALAVVWGA